MKLQVRPVDTPRGPKVVLCDESGAMLPNQRDVVLTCGIDRADTVTVTFVIDDDKLRIVAE